MDDGALNRDTAANRPHERVHLSILLPTHRVGLAACSRVLDVCSWAGDDIEVIVRENSANADKRMLLSKLEVHANCHIIIADECGAEENWSAVMAAARGEFVLFAADDDYCSRRAIDAVRDNVVRHGRDESVVGITGHYLFEAIGGTQLLRYEHLDSPSAAVRFAGYRAAATNVMFYSALRRTTLGAIVRFGDSMPFRFSYYDQIFVMSALLSGRYVDINRVIYTYDNSGWDGVRGLESDFGFYRTAGIDRAVMSIHWLLCAFEGAKIILSDAFGQRLPSAERLAVAGSWYGMMVGRLRQFVPQPPQTLLDGAAITLREKWIQAQNVDLDALLADLADFLTQAIDDKAQAARYREFWFALRPRAAAGAR